METGGSFSGGDLPDDPHGPNDEAGTPQRGWVSPEDRLWRHPSEVGRLGLPDPVPPLFGAPPGTPGARMRRGSIVAGVVGAAALATTVAVVLTLVDTESSSTGRQGAPNVHVTAATTALSPVPGMTPTIGRDVTRVVDTVRPSLVGLQPATAAGTHMTGVVLAGGLVVTAASAVGGASRLDVFTADGKRHSGRVVGSDLHAGVAVISTDVDVAPAATFADEAVEPDDLVVAACLCARQHPSTSPAASVGMVRQVGTGAALDGGARLVNVIEAEMPFARTSAGGVLLDGRGHVIGILDGQTNEGDDTLGVFVPAALAEGVALELAKSHHVEPGWLGVMCTDGGLGRGAQVSGIVPKSPASAAGLEPGDVVVAVGTHPVASVADLQARLYTMPPGQDVELSVERGTARRPVTVTVQLASDPDD